MMEINSKILDKINSADTRLNKLKGFAANDVLCYIETLLITGSVEVGYRGQCGATHHTHKVFREFVKILGLLKMEGFVISEEPVKHKNSYATANGGFWNSVIYKIKITEQNAA